MTLDQALAKYHVISTLPKSYYYSVLQEYPTECAASTLMPSSGQRLEAAHPRGTTEQEVLFEVTILEFSIDYKCSVEIR